MTPRFSLGAIDWRKLGVGFLMAVAGALLSWITAQLVPVLNETGNASLLALAAVLSVLVNAARKWISDTRLSNREITAARGDIRP